MHPTLAAFPQRALTLRRPGLLSWWALLIGALMGGVLVADLIYIVPSMFDELRLRDAPTVAKDAQMTGRGKCSTRLIITQCEFDLVFRDMRGEPHISHQNVVTLLSKVDTALPLELRYDAAAPHRVSSTWGRDLLTSRVFAQALIVGMCGLVLFGVALWHREAWRERRKLAGIARRPRAMAATLVGVSHTGGDIDVRFRWADPGSGAQREDSTELEAGTEPWWLDAEHTRMLAIAGTNGRAQVLDSQLRNVVLDDAERRALAHTRREIALAEDTGRTLTPG
jgi:hypothetical protein